MRRSILLAIILAAAGCSTTTQHNISQEQKNPEWQPVAFDSIAVVSITNDRSARIGNESVFVDELKRRGIDARTTFDVAPDLAAITTDENIRDAFDKTGADAILTISVASSAAEYDYTDKWANQGLLLLLGASSQTAHNVSDLGDMSDYYGQGKLSLDIGLWDAKTYQLAWNAITDSYEMDAGAEGAKNLADFMVATMVERGFVAP